jgi:Rab proteins geranylgeranyltransferase component A
VWTNAHSDKLGASRSYTLTLSPHLIYSQSALLPAIVSSRLHTQLDFQAVGTWWIYQHASQDASAREGRNAAETNSQDVQGVPVRQINGTLQKIPSNREDVFADDTLSQRDKRSLMKFLRSVLAEPAVEAESNLDIPLSSALTSQFGLAPFLHQPLLALSLSYDSAKAIRTQTVAPRIRRHMRSIGAFGAGFGAVLPKYGGGGEIAQVACRASAVGGAVYVLGRGLKKVIGLDEESTKAQAGQAELVASELSDGEKITSRFVVGCGEDFPADVTGELATDLNGSPVNTVHSISVVSSPLEHLFPPTSENGPVPAGAVVVYTDHDDHKTPSQSGSISEDVPTYMVIHSSDSGECPPGQCKSRLRRSFSSRAFLF